MLAQSRGVSLRRSGGLGSRTNLAIHGLSDDRVRVFVDGVPVDYSGFGSTVADVPVNLVDRVDLHRGVVPISLGADALGGAVDIRTADPQLGTHGAASMQLGAFGTYRLATAVSHRLPTLGAYAQVTAFLDYAENNFDVDVEVPNPSGQLEPATVPRFHDAYYGRGTTVEFGILNRQWAKRLSLRGYYAEYDKEIQHNFDMSVPYGEVLSNKERTGATMDWTAVPHHRIQLALVAGYSYRETEFLDVSTCAYDWYGRCVFDSPATSLRRIKAQNAPGRCRRVGGGNHGADSRSCEPRRSGEMGDAHVRSRARSRGGTPSKLVWPTLGSFATKAAAKHLMRAQPPTVSLP